MKILEVRDTAEGTKHLVELSANETAKIQRAMTAPVKRTVKRMSLELAKLRNEIENLYEFNEDFIHTFYGGHKPSNKKKVVKNGGKKK